MLQSISCMLKSIEDNGSSREVGLFFRGVVKGDLTANIIIIILVASVYNYQRTTNSTGILK